MIVFDIFYCIFTIFKFTYMYKKRKGGVLVRKINLISDIETEHLEYFKANILTNLENSLINNEIIFEDVNVLESNRLLKRNFTNLIEIKSLHENFIAFCIDNHKILAKGVPNELINLVNLVRENHKEICQIMELDLSTNKKIKNKNSKNDVYEKFGYSDKLLVIFGYKEFTAMHSLFKVAKKLAFKRYKTKNGIEPKIYSKKLYPEVREILSEIFNIDNRELIKNSLESKEIKMIIKNSKCYITADNFKEFKKIFGWNAYTFVFMSNIRVCPYCNRQYITPVYSEDGMLRADIDHFYPKSKYPYLSMSIYNLVPCCKFCNSSLKGQNEIDFSDLNPYNQSYNDYFEFSANPIDFTINVNKTTLGINNVEPTDKYLNMFKIKELYSYHSNQAEEIFIKKNMYPEKYINDLYSSFSDLFASPTQLKELIVGYFEDEDKISDEVCIKFRRDIAKQVGFIEDKIDYKKIKELKDILRRGNK